MAHAPAGGNARLIHLFVAGCLHNLRHPEAGWVTRVTFTVSTRWQRWTSVAELLRPHPFEFKDVQVTLPPFAPHYIDPVHLATALGDYFGREVQGYFWKSGSGSGCVAEGVTCPLRWEAHFQRMADRWVFESARGLPLETQLPQGNAHLVPIPADTERLACPACLTRLQGNPRGTYPFEFADQGLGDDQFQIYGKPGELRRRAVAGPNVTHVLGVPLEATLLCVSCRESATPGYRSGERLDALHEPHRAFSARTGEEVDVPSGA